MGEVDGEDGVGLRGQELFPGRAGPQGAGSMPAVFRICQTAGGCRLLGQAAPRRPLPQRTTGEVNTVQRRDRLGGLLPLVDDQGAARRAKTDPADFVMLSTKGVSGCLDLNGMRFQSAVGTQLAWLHRRPASAVCEVIRQRKALIRSRDTVLGLGCQELCARHATC